MTTISALTKTSRDGRAIEIKAHLSTDGHITAEGLVAGKSTGRQYGISRLTDAARRKLPALYTHAVGQVVLTDAEAAQVQAALDRLSAEWRASEAGQRAALVAERQDLAREIRHLLDEGEDRAERYHATGSGDGHEHAIRAEYERKAEAARVKLAAFDAAHPEIIAALRAEREAAAAESAERNRWN